VVDSGRALEVWCFERRAGLVFDTAPALSFAYDETWVGGSMPPLSQSLPLDGAFGPEVAAAFFGGLLPEGVPREVLARRLGVSVGNDFGMLAALGGDTAGAISLQPPGHPPPSRESAVEWLDESALVDVIDQLPTRPMHADEDGEYRLSLAGAQDKLPVVVKDGRVGLTMGRTPSTHILKTAIERLDDTIVNEAFCLTLGARLGIESAVAVPHRVAGREFLLVERYDRGVDAQGIVRLHQEDFCQALGVPTQRKYQSEGGPSLADSFALLRSATAVPASEIRKLVDDVALSFLVGNHDAHGKNYSLLYLPGSANAVLAPAYDVLSTAAYWRRHNLTRKMAMSIGGEYRPDYVKPRHLDRMLEEANLGAAATRRLLRRHAERAPGAAREVRNELVEAGWDAPVLGEILDAVDQRAKWLAEIAAPTASTSRRRELVAYHPQAHMQDMVPRHLKSSIPRLRVGQRWRALPEHPDRDLWTHTIEGFDEAGGTVSVSSRRDGTADVIQTRLEAGRFSELALLSDPEWGTHLVAARVDHRSASSRDVVRSVGEIQGARSHALDAEALGGPETCFRVVAPSEREAIALVQAVVGDAPVRAAPHWAEEP
jgi:serine/threonine-protein kinase HipA